MINEELRNKQKQEAIKRLEILENEYLLHKNVLKEFKQDETIYYSETFNKLFSGILYWLRNKDEFIEKVNEIEEKRNIYVYHCILTHTAFGDLLTMLYVSNDEEFWDFEKEQLQDGYSSSYVWNMSFELDSGFGDVGINGVNGGIVRRY